MFRLPLSTVSLTTGRLVIRSQVSNPLLFASSSSPSLKPRSRLPFVPKLSQRYINMDAQELKSFLADSPPSVVRLEIAKHFEALTDKQKRYAHYIAK